ncbi:hypothetical protein CEUSTIGMA_g5277.t1 [Chlamydomonas eustigma]|uniref:Uncharacterized protein n=1 Tax=Chlamydomonas eustigma TaxID=1157962 RepID=A0A250X436_9CHLO|nr:hypothetical protein CEUSTIGMA_g5277.t1 [Chlamydomonas eustigma]|eukprot:GAX77835.1 hypothetical protein CEUSTIGMA_g5277.t1 [Chlamydomonas eustigma]
MLLAGTRKEFHNVLKQPGLHEMYLAVRPQEAPAAPKRFHQPPSPPPQGQAPLQRQLMTIVEKQPIPRMRLIGIHGGAIRVPVEVSDQQPLQEASAVSMHQAACSHIVPPPRPQDYGHELTECPTTSLGYSSLWYGSDTTASLDPKSIPTFTAKPGLFYQQMKYEEQCAKKFKVSCCTKGDESYAPYPPGPHQSPHAWILVTNRYLGKPLPEELSVWTSGLTIGTQPGPSATPPAGAMLTTHPPRPQASNYTPPIAPAPSYRRYPAPAAHITVLEESPQLQDLPTYFTPYDEALEFFGFSPPSHPSTAMVDTLTTYPATMHPRGNNNREPLPTAAIQQSPGNPPTTSTSSHYKVPPPDPGVGSDPL